jgi:hypothetical protein
MTSPITLPYYTKSAISREKGDGASRDRTGDLLLAKQALSQLSYGPSWAEFTPEEPSSEGRCRRGVPCRPPRWRTMTRRRQSACGAWSPRCGCRAGGVGCAGSVGASEWPPPEEVAAAILYLASPEATMASGTVLDIKRRLYRRM